MFTFDEHKHEYKVDGIVLPSVTQILKPISPNFSKIPHAVLEAKRQLGTDIHLAIEYYLQGNLDESSIPENMRGYFEGFLKFEQDRRFQVLLSEKKLYHKTLRYAGTLDLYGLVGDGRLPAIIDVKCVSVLGASVGPQTEGYKQLLKNNDYPCGNRYALHLKPDSTYELAPYKDKNDLNIFISLVNIHNWRENNGIKH